MANATPSDLDIASQILVPRAIFGFNGNIDFGMRLHPDSIHMLFPLGKKMAVWNTENNKQTFMSGHTHDVSCLEISADGKFIASGQMNHMGFPGYVILWDFAELTEITRHGLHKVGVQSICFTANDKFMVSVGIIDDGNIIVFDMEARTPICRAYASNSIFGSPTHIVSLHNSAEFFICSGKDHIRLWSIQREQKKVNVADVFVKFHRHFTRAVIEKTDENMYLGTMSGDIMKIHLNCCDIYNVTKPNKSSVVLCVFGTHNVRKPYGKDCNRFVNGVRDLKIIQEQYPSLLLIGAGDGTLALIEERTDVTMDSFKKYPSPTIPLYKILKQIKVNGSITSIVEIKPHEYYIGTNNNEIYRMNTKTFELKLLMTCHKESVNDIDFPNGLSTVFATAGYENIRIWSIIYLQELLRIMVYNFKCTGVKFTNDGTSIVSIWNDGIIRAFTPITGRLIYAIPNAHNKGCSALAVSSNGQTLVTGGVEGQVRVWKIQPFRQSLIGVLKDHVSPVSSVHFNHNDTEVVSSSLDGFCVIWDLQRMTRRVVLAANTQFMDARFSPKSAHIITCATDGIISYWMAYKGALIREIYSSKRSSVNSVRINATGEYFVTGGQNQSVRIWDYNEGLSVGYGSEHSSAVLSVSISPCSKYIVSGSQDGTVIIWDVPKNLWCKEKVEEKDEKQSIPNQKSKEKLNDIPKQQKSKEKLPTISKLAEKIPDAHRSQPPLAPKASKTKYDVSAKVNTSRTKINGNKSENINGLIAKTSKGNFNKVECPLIDRKIVPKLEKCNMMPNITNC